MRAIRIFGRSVAVAVVLLVALFLVAGCTTQPPVDDSSLAGPVDPVTPESWNLSTPASAVYSYLDWVSFSYRMANSEIPTATMTPIEGVRVDSYIELNRQQGRGIEQTLVAMDITSESVEGTRAVITASEEWNYRYFSLDTLEYVSDELEASYDTTYTLVLEDGRWLVDEVEATSSGDIE